ncbi:uncharacterized protein GGS25DRAFT_280131 [Hypoxylon fragiforme]|uniref:uncharacterized protein n=1 Tax=Hypoxylon fragiforme TaxID=63214 RepID=UPI0020C63E9E|nr:uncharacterized protein GGS25DRAFT_280131 [Hypoxylon fragiforme]KAI2608509.1 hypothetical protein GGS25DRAFT_280131 [Hypoxylon fragiforme]
MAKNSIPSVACCQEADEDGILLPGSEPHYARSTAPSSVPSQEKQKPNTSRSRKDSSHRDRESKSSPTSLSDTDIPEPRSISRRDSKIKMKEEKKRSMSTKQQRPPNRSRNTLPPPSSRISDESAYYGVRPQSIVAPASSSRPRARTRPESYYGQRPPMATSAYAHQPPPHPSHHPSPSFPPPPWMAGPPPPPMAHALVHQPMPYPEMNHPGRDLASRFRRPQSAMGYNPPPPPPPKPLEYEPTKEKALTRRASRKASKDHEDSRRMPPPPGRPASTQPNRLVFRPPAPAHVATRRKSVGFEEDDLDDEPTAYKTVARREVEYGSGALPTRPRPQSFDAESVFDVGPSYEMEPIPRGRRNSYYNLEDKVRDASRYQEDVSGGTAPPLTAEALRRVKNGGSSRSTRSTASRDESDYKQSATTRTTRSSDGDDDITIKLPVGAVIEVGNTKIHCKDGGNMNIGRNSNNNNNGASRAGGSDQAVSTYSDERQHGDDRKSRADRPVARTRATSQAGSFSRTRQQPPAPPMYAPSYVHYDDDEYDEPRYAPYMHYREDDYDDEDDDDDDGASHYY